MKLKFRVNEIEVKNLNNDKEYHNITMELFPLLNNNDYFKRFPDGILKLEGLNPEIGNKFKIGKEYSITIEE